MSRALERGPGRLQPEGHQHWGMHEMSFKATGCSIRKVGLYPWRIAELDR